MAKFRILELCKQKGITQKDLAEQIGMTPVGLAKASNGNPTFETLEKIAEVVELFAPSGRNTIQCPCCGALLELKAKEQ